MDKKQEYFEKKNFGNQIGSIYFAHPITGKQYYLRMLNFVKGCQNFEQIRTINGIIYPTYSAACYAMGLLDDDNEWKDCIREVPYWASRMQLRQLFVATLSHCEVTNPKNIWEDNWGILWKDIPTLQRKMLNFPTLELSQEQI